MAETFLQPCETEVIFPGLVREWFFDRKIVVYRLTAVSRNVLRDWSELVLETIENWPEDDPYLAVHDLVAPGVSLQYAVSVSFETSNVGVLPDYRRRAYELLEAREITGNRVALSFNLALSGRATKTLADTQRFSGLNSVIEYRAFYDQMHALAWLALSVGVNDLSTFTK